MDKKDRSEQLSLFWNLCSQDFLDKVRHVLNIKADTNLTLMGVLDAIAEWLKEKRDLASARYKLVMRKNEANELIDDWFCVLKQLALEAGLYEMTPDDWLATLIVCGHSDGETQLKLLEHKPLLNLEDTLKMCRSIEASKQHQSDIKQRAGRQVGAVRNNQKQNNSSDGGNKSKWRKKGRSKSRDKSPSSAKKCFDCDKDWPHPKETLCSAKDHKCKKCDTVGHFERCCGNRKKPTARTSAVKVKIAKTYPDLRDTKVPVNVSNLEGDFLGNCLCVSDSGAQATVCGTGMLKHLDLKAKKKPKCSLSIAGIDGTALDVVYEADLVLEVDGNRHIETVFGVSNIPKKEMFLSQQCCIGLGILHPDFPRPLKRHWLSQSLAHLSRHLPESEGPVRADCSVNAVQDVGEAEIAKIKSDLMKEFKDVFSVKDGLKEMNFPPMKIELKEDAKPFALNAARPIPFCYRDQVKEQLAELEAQGIIAKVGDQVTEWVHPIVIVPKKNGNRAKPCHKLENQWAL